MIVLKGILGGIVALAALGIVTAVKSLVVKKHGERWDPMSVHGRPFVWLPIALTFVIGFLVAVIVGK
jgi:hypothetical protein